MSDVWFSVTHSRVAFELELSSNSNCTHQTLTVTLSATMSRSSGTTVNPPFVSRSAFDALTVDEVEDSEDEQQEEETPQTQVTRFVFTDVCDLVAM